LEMNAQAWFEAQGLAPADRSLERSLDLRYRGQAFELAVPCPAGEITEAFLTEMVSRFAEAHRQVYGYAFEEEPVDVIALRLEATGHVARARLAPQPETTQPLASALTGTREVWLPETGAFTPCPVYD